MKKKIFTAMGLMSGTSMDGVDLSIIRSDGHDYIEQINDKYCEFTDDLYKDLILLRDKIVNSGDLKKKLEEIDRIEKKFTLYVGKIVNEFTNEINFKPDLIGFHGQTIFHNAKEKISKQIGDGHLLSQLTKCLVVNNFRQQDLENNGQGAPLAPVFHYLISKEIKNKFKISYPINIINIGGITNVTTILNDKDIEKDILGYDIAPGNCLIDEWIRKKSNKKFDISGSIASSGQINELILNQAKDNFDLFSINESLDIKNFDVSFVKGLCLEDGSATLTEFTAYLISEGLKKINDTNNIQIKNFVLCGGGRKNKVLVNSIKKLMSDHDLKIKNIDEFNFDGDFIESKAFAYIAIRCFLNLSISFPSTTRCDFSCTGGEIIKNF